MDGASEKVGRAPSCGIPSALAKASVGRVFRHPLGTALRAVRKSSLGEPFVRRTHVLGQHGKELLAIDGLGHVVVASRL